MPKYSRLSMNAMATMKNTTRQAMLTKNTHQFDWNVRQSESTMVCLVNWYFSMIILVETVVAKGMTMFGNLSGRKGRIPIMTSNRIVPSSTVFFSATGFFRTWKFFLRKMTDANGPPRKVPQTACVGE